MPRPDARRRSSDGSWRIVASVALAGCGRLGFDPSVVDAGEGVGVRRRITVENVAAARIATGYSIRVPLPAEIVDEVELAGLRVLGETTDPLDGGYPRLVETGAQNGAIWFALPAPLEAGAQTKVWLRYRDPDASLPPAEPTGVFPLWDEFEGPTLAAGWQSKGAPVVNGSLFLGPGGDHGVTTVPAADGVDPMSVLEARMTVSSPSAAGNMYWVGYQHTGGFGTGPPFVNWVGEDELVFPWIRSGGSNLREATTPQDTLPHLYRIERLPGSFRHYLDDTLISETTIADAVDYSIQLRNQSAVAQVQIDWVRARAFVSPEPLVTVGEAEPGR